MTIKELLRASANGTMPMVKYKDPKDNSVTEGRVSEIKLTLTGYRGCGVKFPKLDFITWFYETDGEDKRKKYMKDLSLSSGDVSERNAWVDLRNTLAVTDVKFHGRQSESDRITNFIDAIQKKFIVVPR